MVVQQIICKILATKSPYLVESNNLTVEHFAQYEDEFTFIMQHKDRFGNVPDEATFLSKFPDFDLVDVQESDKYLIDTIQEEYLYYKAVPILQKCADLLQADSAAAVEYIQSEIPNLEIPAYNPGVDLVQQVDIRFEEWVKRSQPDDDTFIASSFPELDVHTGGWRRGEELVVIFARTGNGKTFVTLEILRSAWEQGNVVGLIEPEMSASTVGYRFDTLNSHISNSALFRGYGADAYTDYVQSLKENTVPFWVAHPRNFEHRVTVSKLRNWCKQNNIQVLAIDGVSYMVDERAASFDNRSVQLMHISEDLMSLSQELSIPVIIISQANRTGATTEMPGVESVRDSDGIAFNASIMLSLRNISEQDEKILAMNIGKSRNGPCDITLQYTWDIDHGFFSFRGEATPEQEEQDQVRERPQRPRATAGTSRAAPREETF